jgi:NitT/TauT family transport system substrate-binding protein
VTIVQQPFDMSLLINGEVDAAQAMTYNEYAQVLEQINPDTGELFQPEDLNVIDFNEVGTAMLQDHIFVNAEWLAEEGNEDIAVSFLKASFRGWAHCRNNFEECVEVVLDNGSTLGESHQAWQLNEINKLIWPSEAGIGIMDEALWEQTVAVALEAEIITEEPAEGAYRSDLAQQALDELAEEYPDLDLTGEEFEPVEVELREGGE